jgi:hypothetical protein
MLRLAADENFNGDIVRGLRRKPDLDIVRIQDAGLSGADDRAVLEWAAREGRILVTHDISTLVTVAFERVADGRPMPGVFAARSSGAIGSSIEMSCCSSNAAFTRNGRGKSASCLCERDSALAENGWASDRGFIHSCSTSCGHSGSLLMFERIGSLRMADSTRAEFDDSVTENDLQHLSELPKVGTLQCSAPVKDSTWLLLNELFFARRPDVELRVYGHYSVECDLAFARRMVNVRRFAADCLIRAKNVGAIADIPELDSLSLGIFELQDFDVLDGVPANLRTLSLGATRSKKPRLDALGRLTSLKTLYIEGQSNGIEAIGQLRALEDLTLR